MIALLAVLAGCGGPDPAADRSAFRELRCDAIADPILADECRLFQVEAEPGRAGEICPRLREPAIRDECRFLAIDRRELVGADAARACGETGKFVAACHANAISREVSALPGMDEAALVREIERIIGQFRRPRPGEAAEIARRRVGGSTSRR